MVTPSPACVQENVLSSSSSSCTPSNPVPDLLTIARLLGDGSGLRRAVTVLGSLRSDGHSLMGGRGRWFGRVPELVLTTETPEISLFFPPLLSVQLFTGSLRGH